MSTDYASWCDNWFFSLYIVTRNTRLYTSLLATSKLPLALLDFTLMHSNDMRIMTHIVMTHIYAPIMALIVLSLRYIFKISTILWTNYMSFPFLWIFARQDKIFTRISLCLDCLLGPVLIWSITWLLRVRFFA